MQIMPSKDAVELFKFYPEVITEETHLHRLLQDLISSRNCAMDKGAKTDEGADYLLFHDYNEVIELVEEAHRLTYMAGQYFRTLKEEIY